MSKVVSFHKMILLSDSSLVNQFGVKFLGIIAQEKKVIAEIQVTSSYLLSEAISI